MTAVTGARSADRVAAAGKVPRWNGRPESRNPPRRGPVTGPSASGASTLPHCWRAARPDGLRAVPTE